jgi:integrase
VRKFTARTAEGVRERSPGSFEIRYEGPRDRAGRRKALSVTFRCDTIDGALRERRRLQAEVDAGRHIDHTKLTVADHVEKRINQWVALDAITPKTAMRYRELAANQIAPFIGDFELQKLKTIDIEEWHGALLASGRRGGGALSKRTVRHAHMLLSKALAEAVKHELVIKNVAALQPPPTVDREEIAILTREQIRDVLDKLKHRVIYPKVIIALFTGVRRGELLALRRGAIDFDRKIISIKEALEETDAIRFKTPKSAAGVRDVAMPDIVAETLRTLIRQDQERRLALGLGKMTDDALIFTRLDGAPQSPLTLSKEWRKAAASIGLDGVSFHALRHTHASHLIDAGIDVVKISKRLGHASPTITLAVYSHLFDKHGDKSAQAINDAVAGLLSA